MLPYICAIINNLVITAHHGKVGNVFFLTVYVCLLENYFVNHKSCRKFLGTLLKVYVQTVIK